LVHPLQLQMPNECEIVHNELGDTICM
jgi:hypothetical protein